MNLEKYLESKTDLWLHAELDQAMAQGRDASQTFDERDKAFAAAYVIAREIERRGGTVDVSSA